MIKVLFVCHGNPSHRDKKHWNTAVCNTLRSISGRFTTDLQQYRASSWKVKQRGQTADDLSVYLALSKLKIIESFESVNYNGFEKVKILKFWKWGLSHEIYRKKDISG